MVKKVIPYIIGAGLTLLVLMGVVLLLAPKGIITASAVVTICLSLASGLLLPNPVSFLVLVAGICMLVFPSSVMGIIFICTGASGALLNLILNKKRRVAPRTAL